MNPNDKLSESAWEKRLREARADVGPGADVPALLRAVHRERTAAPTAWQDDFTRLFASRGVIGSCLAGAAAFAVVATWHALNLWECVPWAQLLDSSAGGGL